jgi:hypothetical protein
VLFVVNILTSVVLRLFLNLFLCGVVAIEGHVVVEMESREVVSPPSIDSEVGMEEKVDITEQEALEVQDDEPAEDIAQVDISSPNNEEPASPPVQSYSSPSPPSHPLEEDSTSTGEKPKVSYASIVSYSYASSFSVTELWNYDVHVDS